MHLSLSFSIVVLIGLVIYDDDLVKGDQLPTCHPEDFKYAFTECDEYDGRWRVSIPLSPKKCTGGAPNAPIRVSACFISCDPGQYFNSTTLDCQSCQPGFYSLGGGLRFDSFNSKSLPNGFHNFVETAKEECVGWSSDSSSNYLESTSSLPGGCVSILTYTVKIVKRGKLRFTYQYFLPDDLGSSILFTFQYRNLEDTRRDHSLVPKNLDNYEIKFPSTTKDQLKWKTIDTKVANPGLYVFTWKSVTIGHTNSYLSQAIKQKAVKLKSDSSKISKSDAGYIRIKSIEVDGVAYASECTPCPPGSYSDESETVNCKPCPANTAFDKFGATICNECDREKEYAPHGSEKCFAKPVCGGNDYYEIVSECDLAKSKQTLAYKWIEPKICRDEKNVLPESHEVECNSTSSSKKIDQLCNAGMEMTDRENDCNFCGENEYNDGTLKKCQRCPPSTAPLYALSYTIWHNNKPNDDSLPPFVSTQCISADEGLDCDSSAGWTTTSSTKHYIRTSPSALLNSYLILNLTSPGFRNPSGGEVSFNFEIDCMFGDNCQLIFVELSRRTFIPQSIVIHEWQGDVIGLQTFKYRVEQNTTISFGWIFHRERSFQSHVKIYEITIKDTLVGGAIKCNPCPKGSGISCVPCPFGQYLDVRDNRHDDGHGDTEIINEKNKTRSNRSIRNIHSENTKCSKCADNSVINTSLAFPVGVNESCIKCGPGLTSNQAGTKCQSDCQIDLNGEKFDLSQIKNPLQFKGGHLFTAGGTQYFHLFNISLCGHQGAICMNNITAYEMNEVSGDDMGIVSMICRSTIIPDGDQFFGTQSVSLGDELIAITRNTTYKNITVHSEFITTNSDIHLYFVTSIPTPACIYGRRVTLTIRCAPELEEDLTISTPKSCPDGTCDGCNFHFLIRTKTAAACRTCKSSDYETVVGECTNGVQRIHYVNPKGCIISPNGTIPIESRHCSLIPKQVQFGIMLVSMIGLVLLVLVFHFWKKNRSLEYKYCKLIENEKSADCCVDDDDEDEDEDDDETRVTIKGNKHKVSGERGYETIHLTKHDREDSI